MSVPELHEGNLPHSFLGPAAPLCRTCRGTTLLPARELSWWVMVPRRRRPAGWPAVVLLLLVTWCWSEHAVLVDAADTCSCTAGGGPHPGDEFVCSVSSPSTGGKRYCAAHETCDTVAAQVTCGGDSCPWSKVCKVLCCDYGGYSDGGAACKGCAAGTAAGSYQCATTAADIDAGTSTNGVWTCDVKACGTGGDFLPKMCARKGINTCGQGVRGRTRGRIRGRTRGWERTGWGMGRAR